MRFLGGFRDFVDEVRDPKPRLKPGITFFRLTVFVVSACVLCVVGLNAITLTRPSSDDCEAKGIDPQELKEGTCMNGETTLVVVDRHSVLKLGTSETRLLTVGYRKIAGAPSASESAGDLLITFGLSVRNLTDEPALVRSGNFVLYAVRDRNEDTKFERGREPHSFLAQGQDIPPGGTVEGTVIFRVPAFVARVVRQSGNLDVFNLTRASSHTAPKTVAAAGEYGVIRTYH